MTMTTTSTPISKKARTAQPALSVPEIIRQGLLSHEGYQAASEKLEKLEAQLATVLAEHDQAAAEAKTDTQELASRILRGDELDDREGVFARREALKQKVEAYRSAVATQKQEVDRQRQLASETLRPVLDPIHAERVQQVVAAVDGLSDAVASILTFYGEMKGLTIGYGMADLGRINAMLGQMRAYAEPHRRRTDATS